MNFYRKFLYVIVALMCVIGLTGCEKKQEPKDLLQIIRDRGKLVVGVKYDAMPFGFIDEDGQVKGFDVDLCREIAYRLLGSRNAIEFKQVTSSSRIFSITSGSVDLVAATLSITPKREQIIDFSSPYYIAGQAIMVPKDSNVKTLSDIKNKAIIVVLGSTSEMNIRLLYPESEILGFRTYTDAFSALRGGRGDVLTTDDTIIYGFIMNNPNYVMLKDRLSSEPYGIGFKKGEESIALRETVNMILKNLEVDGTMQQIENKWLNALNTNALHKTKKEIKTKEKTKPETKENV